MSELRLRPITLLGGMTATGLWPLVDMTVFHWLLIALLPSWRHTAKLSLVFPIMHAILYTLTALSLLLFSQEGFEANPDADFGSLKGIIALFEDPTTLFAGWVHYLVFDALVGRWIILDSQKIGVSLLLHYAVIVPILFFTLMAGPMGWLMYIAVRPFLSTKCEKRD
mmetsp:Transcript_45996/g.75144  ORF Transcript_45996/g.75144 Transcript_45996/m.75144 type:complete len:167 (+) Transcript_45996:98-598(+)